MATRETDRRQIDTFGVFLDLMSQSSREATPAPRKGSSHRIGVVTEVRSGTLRRVAVELVSGDRPVEGTEATHALLFAYDPDRMSSVGDRVELAPNRSTSRSRRWRVVGIVTSRPGTSGTQPAARDGGQ